MVLFHFSSYLLSYIYITLSVTELIFFSYIHFSKHYLVDYEWVKDIYATCYYQIPSTLCMPLKRHWFLCTWQIEMEEILKRIKHKIWFDMIWCKSMFCVNVHKMFHVGWDNHIWLGSRFFLSKNFSFAYFRE